MPKFAANLTTMFPELEPAERFRAAAHAGFEAVEFLRPYEFPAEQVREWLDANGLRFLLLNTLGRLSEDHTPGAGIIPGREAEFREIVERAIRYSMVLGGDMIHVTAGFVQPGVDNHQVLELSNTSREPLAIHPGVRICQFIFERTEGRAVYEGMFRDQTRV